MKPFLIGVAAVAVLSLAGCSSATSEVVSEESTSVESGSATDVALCNSLDAAMNDFMSTVLAGEGAESQWAALNPIFLSVEPGSLENSDLLQSAAVFAGITLTNASGNEEMIGEKTADLLYACESVGAPLVLTQATLDAATK